MKSITAKFAAWFLGAFDTRNMFPDVTIAQIIDDCDFQKVLWRRAFASRDMARIAGDKWVEMWKQENPDEPHDGPCFGLRVELESLDIWTMKDKGEAA